MTKPNDPTIGKDGKRYPLTPKQEAFVTAYLETSNASEAYRRVYGDKGWTPQAIHVAASRTMDNQRIQGEIERRRAKVAAKVEVTLETLIAECDEGKQLALATKNAGAFISATQLKAKLTGNLTEKVDQTVRQAAPEEHKPDLGNLRQKSRDAAQQTPSAMQPERDSELDGRVTH